MQDERNNQIRALKAHLALNVKDINKSIEFYKANLTLNQVAEVVPGALSHLGIQVESTADVLTTRERWIEAGLLTRDEMQTNCCYALQDKTWVADPDGNQWEVFVVLQDNLPTSSACCSTDVPAPVANEKSVQCC